MPTYDEFICKTGCRLCTNVLNLNFYLWIFWAILSSVSINYIRIYYVSYVAFLFVFFKTWCNWPFSTCFFTIKRRLSLIFYHKRFVLNVNRSTSHIIHIRRIKCYDCLGMQNIYENISERLCENIIGLLESIESFCREFRLALLYLFPPPHGNLTESGRDNTKGMPSKYVHLK